MDIQPDPMTVIDCNLLVHVQNSTMTRRMDLKVLAEAPMLL
jgi:hypothetical protein